FCNVVDVVGALAALAECGDAVGEVINVGSDEMVSIEELADRILQMTGSKSGKCHVEYEQVYGRAFDDLMVRMPNLEKVKRLIGFQPKYTLEQTLQQVIDYEKTRI
ncbi:MAG: nucleoside-diphosphate sugar epimerase, partial [Phycisphaerae bacterium]|nr:nucleoside-diphosphate sugar epimerase [Phycisphaerae bacterium]